MGYLFYVNVSLALAILALLFWRASIFASDHSTAILKFKIKKGLTKSSAAAAAQKLLSLDSPDAIETSRKLMRGYREDFGSARLLISSLRSTPNPQLTNTLIELSLQRVNCEIQRLALTALESCRQDESTLKVFQQLFGDNDPIISSTSAWALAKAGHREAFAYLMQSGVPDAEIEKLVQPASGARSQLSPRFFDEIFDQFQNSKLSDVDALKLGMLLLGNVDKYPTGLVSALFRMRNRGAYQALAQSLDGDILLDTETLRSLARMGYSQVAGRLADDLLRFGWQSQSSQPRAEEEVGAAKSALEELLQNFGIQISLPHLQKIADIQDFYFWAESPVRIHLIRLREEASALIARHIEFWGVTQESKMTPEPIIVPPKGKSSEEVVSKVAVASPEECVLNLAT